MENSKVSVIVPVYNVEAYLPRCMDSIVGQTYTNLEIILIDDGSTDNSGIICDEYAKKDPRIKVIHKANGGISSARNVGLDIFTGEYITFVDSDDFINKDMIEILYGEMIKSKAAYIACGYNYVDSSEKILNSYSVNEITTYSGIQALYRNYMVPEKKENFIVVWGKLFCRELFHNLRFSLELLFEDLYLMPYLLKKCDKVFFIPYVGYNYVKHETSITNKNKQAR